MKYSGELPIIRIVGINNSKVHSFWDETKKKAYKCKRGDRDYYMTLEEIGEEVGNKSSKSKRNPK